jgi:anti-anti-sigma factor
MTANELDQVIVLEPQGEMYEGGECDALERVLLGSAERGNRIVVDVSATHHLSARCLGILARACRLASRSGGCVALCGVSSEHRWLLEKTGLAEVIPQYGDRDAAIRGVHEPPRAVA